MPVPARFFSFLLAMTASACLFAAGCAPKKPVSPEPPAVRDEYRFTRAGQGEVITFLNRLNPRVQGFSSWTALEPGLKSSLRYASAKPASRQAVEAPGLTLTWGEVAETVRALLKVLPKLDRDPGLLLRDFDWFALRPDTLATGYYEPWLKASPVQTPEYPYPLYGLPSDLKTLNLGDFHPRWKGQKLIYRTEDNLAVPYYDRREIDFQHALKGRKCEIAWASDLMDIFVLQIQGSGRLVMPDGSVRHILYNGKNGHEYVSLGKHIAGLGHMELHEVSMQNIRKFMDSHPELQEELLSSNPSYVFFKLSDSGPYGASGAVLTPMGSIAVDRKLIPLGSVVAMSLDLPADKDGRTPRFNGLVMAQDTGGAIKKNHIDLFCGSGEEALAVAGRMKQPAALYVLRAKNGR